MFCLAQMRNIDLGWLTLDMHYSNPLLQVKNMHYVYALLYTKRNVLAGNEMQNKLCSATQLLLHSTKSIYNFVNVCLTCI